MKRLFLVIPLLLSFTLSVSAQRKTFLRFYTLTGENLATGFYSEVTDTSVLVYKNKATRVIPVSQIGTIKTRRTYAHSTLLGIALGAATLGIVGVEAHEIFNAPPFSVTPPGGFIVGGLFGGLIGARIGILLHKWNPNKVVTFTINGNTAIWAEEKRLLKNYQP
jgi:hypothetical protein